MSFPSILTSYLRERMRPSVVLVLTALTSAAALVLSGDAMPEFPVLARTVFAALALVMAFRVWDDLEDRDHDRVHQPERVMSRTLVTRPFVAFALLSLLVAVAFLMPLGQAEWRLACLASAAVLALTWYRGRPRGAAHRVWGAHLVLAKYPLIACAVAPQLEPLFTSATAAFRGVSVLLGLYLVLCIYEALDDPELRRLAHARGVAIVELALLVPLLLAAAASATGLLAPAIR